MSSPEMPGSGSGAGRKRQADNDGDDALRRQRQATVRARVQNLDDASALAFLDDLARRWQLDAPHVSFGQVVDRAFANFGAHLGSDLSLDQLGSFGMRQLDDRVHEHEMEAVALYHKLRELKLLGADASDASGDDDDAAAVAGRENLRRIVKVLELVFHAKRTVMSVFLAKLAMHQAHCPDLDLDKDLDQMLASWQLRFRWMSTDVKPHQDLLLYLLDCAMEKRFRRFNGHCYEPVVVAGHNTHAWRQVCSIQEFVYACVSKESCWQQWVNATLGSKNISAAVEYLTHCRDYQFPALVKQRGVYAFRNGVYLARRDRFVAFGADDPDGLVTDHTVACKFFDVDFACPAPTPAPGEWTDIPTPHLQSILDFQGFAPEVCRWAYVLLGRLLYDVGDLDGWQVVPFFKGQASSGKSTICLRVAKSLFEAIDVGVLSNNIEKKFGLSAFYDKYLFVAPEIKSDLAIEQAEFQSVVSGEDIQVNVKHKKAFSTQWRVPGVLAGNEVPTWCDNSGSVQRRVVLFDFTRTVTAGDMKLGEKLDAELPRILVKANRAYLEAAAAHGHKNVWTVLPRYFHGTRDGMAQDINPVEAFLASDDVVRGPDRLCPMADFKAALRTFALQNNFHLGRYTKDFFRGPFSKAGLDQVVDTREYRGKRLKREYVLGVDVVDASGFENALG